MLIKEQRLEVALERCHCRFRRAVKSQVISVGGGRPGSAGWKIELASPASREIMCQSRQGGRRVHPYGKQAGVSGGEIPMRDPSSIGAVVMLSVFATVPATEVAEHSRTIGSTGSEGDFYALLRCSSSPCHSAVQVACVQS